MRCYRICLALAGFRGEAIVGALGVGTRSERAFTDAEMQELIAEGRRLP
jgi:hypothetical protein